MLFRSIGSTTVSYLLPENGTARISVYNVSGQKVADLVNETLPAGLYTLQWFGKDEHGKMLPAGIYICSLTTDISQKICKLIIATR